jgi:uncharacterized membrane protein
VEALVALVVLGLVGIALVAPILAIVALVRSSRLEGELRRLRGELDALEKRFSILRRTVSGAETATGVPAAVAPAEAAEVRPFAPPPRAAEVAPGPSTPPQVAERPAAPPPVRPPAEAAWTPKHPRPESPAATTKPPSPPPRPATPIAPPPVARPPLPPPEGPGTPFDWEGLLGLKGAAWLGGIALVIAALFLAKYAYDQGAFTPPRRFAAMLLAGVGGLLWAEHALRRGFATTANAVSGAAIAILYVAFYAGHALWRLVPVGPTFALMALVTIVAGLLAIRYDALFTALLGLLGGFATPVALSTGEDRPIGLFSYVLLLNLGLLGVARRRRWHGLLLLGAVLTALIEVGWYGKFMAPGKLGIGLGVFLLFGLFYLFLPEPEDESSSHSTRDAGAFGGLVALAFAVLLSGRREFAGDWPLLLGYLGLLDAALLFVAVARGRYGLLLGGALATAVVLPVWSVQSLSRDLLWEPLLAIAGLAALPNLAPRVAGWLAPERLEEDRARLELPGLLAAAGLGAVGLVLVGRGLGEPPWAFLFVVACLEGLLVERSRAGRIRGVLPAGALAIAVLVQAWFHVATVPDTLVRNLALPPAHAALLSVVAGLRAGGGRSDAEDESGALLATLVSVAGLFGCLAVAGRGADPVPMFAALAVSVLLLPGSALRRRWTPLFVVALAASVAFTFAWHTAYFDPADLGVALPVYVGFCLSFLALPFLLLGAAAGRVAGRRSPWLASALAGPSFFLPVLDAIEQGWGKAWIGAVPLAFGALTLVALTGVARRFAAPRREDAAAAARRLRWMALFAAVALGFVAVAIPLQLERQWITVGWALEGAAVLWLFGRLPHPGLKAFAALLFAGVGVRLLLNPEVLRYEPRAWPVLNWILYTYGLAAASALAGAALLRRAEAARGDEPAADWLPGDRTHLAPLFSLLGLLLGFWLLNLEILDYFTAPGHFVELSFERRLARDLALSAGWGLYALSLLVLGIARRLRPLRVLALGFLLLTVAKVFLYDLAKLEGIHRILSFLGLGVSLILVSLLYQRFVVARERA